MCINKDNLRPPKDPCHDQDIKNVPQEFLRVAFLARFHTHAKDANEYLAFSSLLLSFEGLIYHHENIKRIWEELKNHLPLGDDFQNKEILSKKAFSPQREPLLNKLALETMAYVNHLGRIHSAFSNSPYKHSWNPDIEINNIADNQTLKNTTIRRIVDAFRHKNSAHISYFDRRKKESDNEVFSHLISIGTFGIVYSPNGPDFQSKIGKNLDHISFTPIENHTKIIEQIQKHFAEILEQHDPIKLNLGQQRTM